MNRKKSLWVSLTLLTFCLVLGGVYGAMEYQDNQSLDEAWARREVVLSQLNIGMSRDEVESHLQGVEVQYHCDFGNFTNDYYLFSQNPELAAIISLRFDKQGNNEVLSEIAHVDPHMLEMSISTCTEVP